MAYIEVEELGDEDEADGEVKAIICEREEGESAGGRVGRRMTARATHSTRGRNRSWRRRAEQVRAPAGRPRPPCRAELVLAGALEPARRARRLRLDVAEVRAGRRAARRRVDAAAVRGRARRRASAATAGGRGGSRSARSAGRSAGARGCLQVCLRQCELLQRARRASEDARQGGCSSYGS